MPFILENVNEAHTELYELMSAKAMLLSVALGSVTVCRYFLPGRLVDKFTIEIKGKHLKTFIEI